MVATESTSQKEYEALLVAASKTAGSETWKTRSGRLGGPEGFLLSDTWRCMKITVKKHLKTKNKSLVCPVCMEEIQTENEWYTTKSCRHSICKECLRSYSQNQMSDPSHSGALKCPCCPRFLREDDALVALSLAQDKVTPATKMKSLQLLEKWDIKARNELLRKMDDYRPCPNCQKYNYIVNKTTLNYSSDTSTGGGFITAACLRPINDERESSAQVFVVLAETWTVKFVLFIFNLYYLYCCGFAVQDSELRQVVMAILPAIGLPLFPQLLNLLFVRVIRKRIMRPISVTCPCCEKEFSLPSSEIDIVKSSSSSDESEMATQHWKNVHTRNCPTCDAPIEKCGGCNHVKCGRCQSQFCWACMRARTSCRAFNCHNGAPYGNASATADLARSQWEQLTLMERIDRLEITALEQLRLFPRPELCIPVFCLLFFKGLDSSIWWLICTLVSISFRLFSLFCVVILCWGTSNHCRDWLRREDRAFRTDEELMAEAIARSRREY